MVFTVEIENTGERFPCDAKQNVLKAMEQLRRKGIPVGCRGGGCGVCKIRVIAGCYNTEKMSRACITVSEEAEGFALACRIYPTSDLQVVVVGKMVRAVISSNAEAFAFRPNGMVLAHRPKEEK